MPICGLYMMLAKYAINNEIGVKVTILPPYRKRNSALIPLGVLAGSLVSPLIYLNPESRNFLLQFLNQFNPSNLKFPFLSSASISITSADTLHRTFLNHPQEASPPHEWKRGGAAHRQS